MDTLHILSWNVQGLGGHAFRRFKGLLGSELGTTNVGTIDILFLQEPHIYAWIGFGSSNLFYRDGGLISGFLPLALVVIRLDYVLLLNNICSLSSCLLLLL